MLLGLAACGGGAATTPSVQGPDFIGSGTNGSTSNGNTGGATPTPAAPITSASEMRTARSSLIDKFSPITYTNLTTIPTSGSATFNGYLGGKLANTTDQITDSVIGKMNMSVTFSGSSVGVSGAISEFRDAQNRIMTGQLDLTNAALDRNGNTATDATFTLSADGILRDAQNRALVFGTALEGDFLGDTYNAVGGDVLGRVTHNGSSQDFDGVFIAER